MQIVPGQPSRCPAPRPYRFDGPDLSEYPNLPDEFIRGATYPLLQVVYDVLKANKRPRRSSNLEVAGVHGAMLSFWLHRRLPYVTLEQIGDATGLSREAVGRALDLMVDWGLLISHAPREGQRNGYELALAEPFIEQFR